MNSLRSKAKKVMGLAASGLRRWHIVSRSLCVLGTVVMLAALYMLVYELFFTNLPVGKLTITAAEMTTEEFVVDGVGHFDGTSLSGGGDPVSFQFYLPKIVDLGQLNIEMFLKAQEGTSSKGEIQISGKSVSSHKVKVGDELVRHSFFVDPTETGKNEITLYFDGPTSVENGIVVSLICRGLGMWRWIVGLCLSSGVLLVIGWFRARPGRCTPMSPRSVAKGVTVLALLIIGGAVHLGALASNDFFPDHYNVSAAHSGLSTLLKTGHLPQRYYRNLGFHAIPFASVMIEGDRAMARGFRDIFPTSRFISFVLFFCGVLVLARALCRLSGFGIASAFLAITTLHYPFIVDLYHPDADSYFIIGLPFYLVLIIHCIRRGISLWKIIGLSLIVLVLSSVKPQIAVVVPLTIVALGLTLSWRTPDRRRSAGIVMMLLFSLLVSFKAGRSLNSHYQHPDRNIGIEGVRFQDSVIWHMIWAANGIYDPYSAHGFAKAGDLRNERVSEVVGIEPVTYLRHSQIATDRVYKPAVIRALSENPSFFYSTAWLRAYKHGLKFVRYAYDTPYSNGGEELVEWVGSTDKETQLIRRGRMWKIAPLVFVAKISQGHVTFLIDLFLLLSALVGILLLRHPGLKVFLLGLVAAQIAFSVFVHVPDRYFMFCDFALLIGVAVLLDRAWKVLSLSTSVASFESTGTS